MPSLASLSGDWRFVQGPRSFAATLLDRLGNNQKKRLAPRSVYVRGYASPFVIRPGTSDFACLCEIYRDKAYDRVLALLGPQTKRIIDLGSNAGFSVRRWLDAAPNAQIVAVEPDAECMEMVRHNARAAGKESQLITFQTCIAGSPRPVVLNRGRRDWANRLQEAPDQAHAEMTTTTMDEILRQAGWTEGNIDLLKCDIEGTEAEVFAHCRSWIHRCDLMVIETHRPYTTQRLLADLQSNGREYACEIVDQREHEFEVALLRSA